MCAVQLDYMILPPCLFVNNFFANFCVSSICTSECRSCCAD
nr:MAG TPA: hypothetical protein [Caudoviricetes sp.]